MAFPRSDLEVRGQEQSPEKRHYATRRTLRVWDLPHYTNGGLAESICAPMQAQILNKNGWPSHPFFITLLAHPLWRASAEELPGGTLPISPERKPNPYHQDRDQNKLYYAAHREAGIARRLHARDRMTGAGQQCMRFRPIADNLVAFFYRRNRG